MKNAAVYAAASLAGLAAAAPTKTVAKRAATSECAQYAVTTSGDYTFNNDLWGEANGSGSQCYTLDSSDPLGWTSTWSWSGGQNDVKSYANAVYNGYTKSKLSDISSIPSKWDWSYTGDSIVADVSYDLFTSSTADGSNEYEIMVWLAALGGAGRSTSLWIERLVLTIIRSD
jgi:xyloglucan-specific endo-beta-1,4-glucanase